MLWEFSIMKNKQHKENESFLLSVFIAVIRNESNFQSCIYILWCVCLFFFNCVNCIGPFWINQSLSYISLNHNIDQTTKWYFHTITKTHSIHIYELFFNSIEIAAKQQQQQQQHLRGNAFFDMLIFHIKIAFHSISIALFSSMD